MTEQFSSHVEQQIRAQIAAARFKVQATKEKRASLAEARRAGLARRHAQKLRRLAEAERQAAGNPDEPDDVSRSASKEGLA